MNECDNLLTTTTPYTEQKKRQPKSTGSCRKCLWKIFLLAAIAASYVYDYQLTQELHEVENKLAAQQLIVDRFNTSVSNQDVLDEIGVLKQQLDESTKSFQQRLDNTEQHVESELNAAIAKLDDTVTTAQNQITAQVEMVKNDVNNYVVYTNNQFSQENNFLIYQLAGTFTLLGSLISMWHMTSHLRNFYQPEIQRKILAILWMSPLYGITSWLSLVFTSAEGYLSIIRDCYEAYAIYTFLSFLISVLGRGDRDKTIDVLASQGAEHLPQPIRCCCKKAEKLSPTRLASTLLFQCQILTMQFVLIKPFTSISSFVLTKFYDIQPTNNDYLSPQFYIFVAENISIFMAFSGLLKFYHAVEEELSWCKPLPKFLCIKGVVFMTFWQGLAIGLLAESTGGGSGFGVATNDDVGSANNSDTYKANPSEWALMAQNFLICLEMLLFAIAHFYVFPTEEWHPNYRPSISKTKFGDNIALRDFFTDLKLLIRGGEDEGDELSPTDQNDKILHKIKDLEANMDNDREGKENVSREANEHVNNNGGSRMQSAVCHNDVVSNGTKQAVIDGKDLLISLNEKSRLLKPGSNGGIISYLAESSIMDDMSQGNIVDTSDRIDDVNETPKKDLISSTSEFPLSPQEQMEALRLLSLEAAIPSNPVSPMSSPPSPSSHDVAPAPAAAPPSAPSADT